jgi:hypothetical protein
MRRFGADPQDMRERRIVDVFLSRLKLLIIMSKAYLKGYPIGKYRREAIRINAKQVAWDAVYWEGYFINCESRYESEEEAALDLIFHQDHSIFQRIRMLAMIAKTFAEGDPMDSFRRKSIQDNIDYVCETITYAPRINDVKFLKVA